MNIQSQLKTGHMLNLGVSQYTDRYDTMKAYAATQVVLLFDVKSGDSVSGAHVIYGIK